MHELDAQRGANVSLRQAAEDAREVAQRAVQAEASARVSADKWRRRWEQDRMRCEDVEGTNRR